MGLWNCRRGLMNRKILVDLLAILFGVGAWVSVNGMFVQLPLLVQTQPEKWNLPSYLSVIVQIANIGPILYSVSQKWYPNHLKDSTIIYCILILGCTALLLMTFLYQKTTVVLGYEHSTVLFVLAFFISLVGCTSSVLFMPFMNHFREIYLISYFVGEGLSGFLPSTVALIQGVGGNPMCVNQTHIDPVTKANTTSLQPYTPPPRFSSQSYFIFLFVTLVLSTISFFLLNNLQPCKSQKVEAKSKNSNGRQKSYGEVHSSPKPPSSLPDNIAIIEDVSTFQNVSDDGHTQVDALVMDPVTEEKFLSRPLYIYYLGLVSWLCVFGNGIFPSIQSYSCLPYGNIAYHLSVTLGSMANPLACFLAFFLPYSSVVVVTVLSVLCTFVSAYIATTAVLSPTPPLVGTAAGEALVVLSWVIFTALISYVKVSIASLFRHQGGRSLYWCGAVQQIGSAVGAIIAFFLVNSTSIFNSYQPCQ